MFKIDGFQNIFITRGDSASVHIGLTEPNPPYEEYNLSSQDRMVLSVRKDAKALDDESEPLIQKTSSDSGYIFFSPEDTKDLEYGEYVYDVELTFANGEVNTVIPYTIGELPKFIICGEVS